MDVIGMENDGFWLAKESEPEVSHILRWFCGAGAWYILLCNFPHMELLRSDLQSCCVSESLHLL
jgi:hypothetical protein